MSRTVTLTIRTDGGVEVRSPFEAKDVIKDATWSRRWDKTRKVWVIDLSEQATLTAALRAARYTVTVHDTRPPKPPPPPPRPPQRSWVEQCFDAAPRALRAKLRRSLMSVFHPDLGGDHTLAKEINSVADYHERKDNR